MSEVYNFSYSEIMQHLQKHSHEDLEKESSPPATHKFKE